MHKEQDDFVKIMDVSLTRSCNYNCTYCNQRQDLTKPAYDMSDSSRFIVANQKRSGSEWINGLNDFPYKDEYEKLIFTGGEPSLHPDFFDIVSQVTGYRNKVIVTNLSFDVSLLVEIFGKQNSKIIVQPSFHFEFSKFDEFLRKMKILEKNRMLSHFIPVSIVDLPDREESHEFRKKFQDHGFEASLYKFEGYYKGEFNYANVDIFGSKGPKDEVICSCSTTCVKPNGDIAYCQTDTYDKDARVYGNICDKDYVKIPKERDCDKCGVCHISSASWVKMRDKKTEKPLWKGKNYRGKDILNRIRNYSEKRNFKGLGKIKTIYTDAKRIFTK